MSESEPSLPATLSLSSPSRIQETTMAMLTNPKFLFSFFTILILVFSTNICIAFESEVDDEIPFSYREGTGKGPKKWGKIDPHWRVCDKGKMQSPIDLLDKKVQLLSNLGKLNRDYKPAPATVRNRGHDITVKWKGDAGKIKINGTDYKLVQCHWHSPSEHTFNGTRYNLELHIVHLGSRGEIAVVGITYKYGHPDPFLARIINHISSAGKQEKDLGIVNPGDIKFGSRKYYRYIGSLTVPPCTEGVVWTIVKKVRTVSREQVRVLREIVHDGFEANARPLQELDGRAVLLYTPREKGGLA